MDKITTKYVSFLTLLLLSTSLFATDCKSLKIAEARKINLTNSDVVFLGIKIKDIEGGKSLFKVTTLYKGTTVSLITVNIKSLFFPKIGDVCLIYGKNTESKELLINECSISRSFQNPINYIIHKYPIAPNPNNLAKDSVRFNSDLAILKINSRIELLEELLLLDGEKANNNSSNAVLVNICLAVLFLWLIFLTYKIIFYHKTK